MLSTKYPNSFSLHWKSKLLPQKDSRMERNKALYLYDPGSILPSMVKSDLWAQKQEYSLTPNLWKSCLQNYKSSISLIFHCPSHRLLSLLLTTLKSISFSIYQQTHPMRTLHLLFLKLLYLKFLSIYTQRIHIFPYMVYILAILGFYSYFTYIKKQTLSTLP